MAKSIKKASTKLVQIADDRFSVVDMGEITISTDLASEIVDMVVNDVSDDKASSRTWRDKLGTYADAYLANRDPSGDFPWEWGCDFTIPFIKDAVQVGDAREHAAVFSSGSGKIKLAPVSQNDMENLDKTQDWLDWALTNEVNFEPKMDHTLHENRVYGTKLVKVIWTDETYSSVKTLTAMEVLGKIDKGEIEGEMVDKLLEEISSGAEIVDVNGYARIEKADLVEDIDIKKVYVPGNATDVQPDKAQHVIIEYKRPLSYYLRNKDRYINLDELKAKDDLRREKGKKNKVRQAEAESTDKTAAEEIVEEYIGQETTGNRQSEMLTEYECYYSYDMDGDGITEEYVFWVIKETNTLVRAQRLNYYDYDGKPERPLVLFKYSEEVNSFYGVGLPQALYDIQKEMTAMHRIRIDFAVISTMPYGFYREGSSFDPQTFDLNPGQMIPISDPSDVRFPSLPTNFNTFFNEEQWLFRLGERIGQNSEEIHGQESGVNPNPTVGRTQILVRRSDMLFEHVVKRHRRSIEKVISMLLRRYQDFLPPDRMYRVVDDEGQYQFKKVGTRNEIAGRYDVTVPSDPLAADRIVQLGYANEAYQTLMQNPLVMGLPGPNGSFLMQPNVVAIWEITKRWYEAHPGLENRWAELRIPHPTNGKLPVSQESEIEHMKQQEYRKVDPQDDHLGHIKVLQEYMENPNFQLIGDIAKQLIDQHLTEHSVMIQQQMQQIQMQMSQVNEGGMGASTGNGRGMGGPPQQSNMASVVGSLQQSGGEQQANNL